MKRKYYTQAEMDKYYLSPEWAAIRAKRLEYDNYTCVCCMEPAVEVNHKTYERFGGDELLTDLGSMCKHHHDLITNDNRKRRYEKSQPIKPIPIQKGVSYDPGWNVQYDQVQIDGSRAVDNAQRPVSQSLEPLFCKNEEDQRKEEKDRERLRRDGPPPIPRFVIFEQKKPDRNSG